MDVTDEYDGYDADANADDKYTDADDAEDIDDAELKILLWAPRTAADLGRLVNAIPCQQRQNIKYKNFLLFFPPFPIENEQKETI